MGEERYLSLKVKARAKNLKLERLIDAGNDGELAMREFAGEWYIQESEVPKLVALDNERGKNHQTQYSLLRSASRLLLLVSIIFVGQFVWQAQGWQYLNQSLTALAVLPTLQNNTASVFSDVTSELTQLWFATRNLGQTLILNINYAIKKITVAWSQFLGRSSLTSTQGEPVTNVTTSSGLDPVLLAELKAEIMAELTQEFSNQSRQTFGPMSKLPSAGLVTLPASGNEETDAMSLSRLQETFSDQVEVQFGASRQTGIITPVFKTGRGDNYLFVITPINSQKTP